MQVTPFVLVRDLAPSASFYAAIAQPLGLRYISASSSSIIFGDITTPIPEPVFEVKQSTDTDAQPLRPCHLILSANSPLVVAAFHAAALRAHPNLEFGSTNVNHLRLYNNSDSESRARIGDFDGNIMEVVHGSLPGYAASHAGSMRRAQSSSHEVSRVLDWNLDVGSGSVASRSPAGSVAPGSSVSSRTAAEPFTLMRKSATTSTVEVSPRESPKGLSTTALVGGILGVAVGAAVGGALSYNMVKDNRERERMAFQEHNAPPPFLRRQTCPDNYPTNHQPRYYPPTSYSGGHSQAGARSRVAEEIDDRSSRHSSHYTTGSHGSQGGHSRGRSESGSSRRPLLIADVEHKSNAGSKTPDSPRLLMDSDHRSHAGSRHSSDSRGHTGSRRPESRHSPESDYRGHKHTNSRHRDPEAETYVSARSERSSGTTRRSPPSAYVETAPPSRASSRPPSQAGSYYSSATVRPAGPSRAHSQISARNVPGSYFGSCYGGNGWDDDAGSIAPSESVSNIGRHNRSMWSQRT
ncbi:hypothetical protein F4804DRAFT_331310 [Jackrogersella minutella]|nr:hypothetical protein F4804DRAFT_331310 [Jackrogersella minutella]